MMRRILTFALTFAGLRALAGGLFMLASLQSGEAAMLVLLDLPTMGAYWGLHLFGYEWGIVDAYDVRYWCVGLVVWSLIGAVIGLLMRPRTTR